VPQADICNSPELEMQMSIEVLLAVALTTAIPVWIAAKHAIAVRQSSVQRHVAAIGIACQGRVVAIQRPFMLDDCTRLYIDFLPDGANQPVRACHVERSESTERPRALPAEGTVVTVRYLPHRPQQAVIGQLVR
jgi:hypothetical protein